MKTDLERVGDERRPTANDTDNWSMLIEHVVRKGRGIIYMLYF